MAQQLTLQHRATCRVTSGVQWQMDLEQHSSPMGLGEPHALDTADAVATAYDDHQPELYAFLLRTTRSPEAAEDLLQETFLRFGREVAAGRTPDNARAWLYKVATNLAVSRGRHLQVLDRFQRRPTTVTHADSAEVEVLRRERTAKLNAELATLPRDARAGLLLAAQGFTGAEVATLLCRSESATRTMLCRARLRLRERLAPEEMAR
jgi:RNA polymerase sigma-70 factor (ECF subfamily)